jgi:hypothetical protein
MASTSRRRVRFLVAPPIRESRAAERLLAEMRRLGSAPASDGRNPGPATT